MLTFTIFGGRILLRIYKTVKQAEKKYKEQTEHPIEGQTNIEIINNKAQSQQKSYNTGEYIDYEEIKNE